MSFHKFRRRRRTSLLQLNDGPGAKILPPGPHSPLLNSSDTALVFNANEHREPWGFHDRVVGVVACGTIPSAPINIPSRSTDLDPKWTHLLEDDDETFYNKLAQDRSKNSDDDFRPRSMS